ncbi:MAG: hypothetical protein AB7K67_15330 [Hyphomicrobiaceae bacterium]
MTIDVLFYLAVGAFAWGLSLATYRMFAMRYDWPMGAWHRDHPNLPIAIGLVCMVLASLFAAARGYGGMSAWGWAVPVLGIAFGILWTGFLRVGAQVALILAPLTAAALMIRWMA